jgi:hypothetical protein
MTTSTTEQAQASVGLSVLVPAPLRKAVDQLAGSEQRSGRLDDEDPAR